MDKRPKIINFLKQSAWLFIPFLFILWMWNSLLWGGGLWKTLNQGMGHDYHVVKSVEDLATKPEIKSEDIKTLADDLRKKNTEFRKWKTKKIMKYLKRTINFGLIVAFLLGFSFSSFVWRKFLKDVDT